MTRVYLSIGSNVEPEHNIRGSIRRLDQMYAPLTLSSVYQSAPVGFEGSDFYNMAVGFDTARRLPDVRRSLRTIENDHGRKRGCDRFGPRPLDIDLLLFGDLVRHTAEIDLPRQEIRRYAFVLLPLSEIAPDLRHPETGESLARMWRELDGAGQPICRIDFDFSSDQGTIDRPPSTGIT